MANKEQKEPFKFEYAVPALDWYAIKRVEIKPDDFKYFKVQRRYGPSWWLIGMNTKEEPNYHWEDTEIKEIKTYDLKKFIEWAKTEHGSKIVKIDAISGSFDIIEEIKKLIS